MRFIARVTAVAAAAFVPFTALAQEDGAEVKPIPAEMMPLAPKSLLLDVVDTGKRLIAVGERGHVVVSLDGKEWVQAPTPTRATLNAVEFADDRNGWAVGHDAAILRTKDGGKTWTLQNFEPELEKPLLDVIFLDNRRGIAIGAYSLMYGTTDGGETWEEVDTPIREDEWHFNKIIRLNDGSLFIAGEAGTLAHAADGENWENIDSPYDSSLFGAAPVGESGVAIFGLRGNAFWAEDASDPDWQRIESGQEQSFIGGATIGDGEIVLVGINGIIFETRDGLSSVRKIDNPVGITLAAVQPVKGGYVVVGEAGAQYIQR